MKRVLLLIALLTTIKSTSASGENLDSLVLFRVFTYQRHYATGVNGFSTNVYIKNLYQTHKRNATLWVVPSMYAIARGQRAFVSEQYSRFTFNDVDDYDNHRQVYYTTIPHQRRTMPVLVEYLTPDLYNPTLYNDHILSPFNRENRVFYHYTVTVQSPQWATVHFRPRFVNNTQLVRGQATIEIATGRIERVEMEGEFDMIHFRTHAQQGDDGARALLPKISETNIEFKFLGNHISSRFKALFDCPVTLPDTLSVKGDRSLIDSVRPVSLTDEEQYIYAGYEHKRRRQPQPADTLPQPIDEQPQKKRRRNYLKEIGWDMIGENLLRSIRTSSDNGYLKLSPIINPQYISYSQRKGLSYRIKLGARYNFSESSTVEFNPRVGYNFKLREFYFNVPLKLIYDDGLDGQIEVVWGNNNRIANADVLEDIRKEYGDLPELDEKDLDLFDDHYLRAVHSITPTRWLNIETGLVYHLRHAVNSGEMERFGKPTEYQSLAPSLGLKIRPTRHAPLLSIDYERGLRVRNSDLDYERWEADISHKWRMHRMQTLNMRLGGGLYTRKAHNYFMDYTNFHDENLPEGWDDDWSGNFQLLRSRLYNASDYYVRGNISYESPLLGASMIPLLGHYVERERVYLSSLSIAHTRLYSELGYGFTCRYASMAFFASFLNTEFQEAGCKFTFELFRRW